MNNRDWKCGFRDDGYIIRDSECTDKSFVGCVLYGNYYCNECGEKMILTEREVHQLQKYK